MGFLQGLVEDTSTAFSTGVGNYFKVSLILFSKGVDTEPLLFTEDSLNLAPFSVKKAS